MKGRISFKRGAVQHIYQKTKNGYLIFYSARDCLVFFTIISMAARKCGVRVIGLCLMVDHVHVLVEAASKEQLSRFVHLYTMTFSKAYNRAYPQAHLSFCSPFGRASKVGDKKIKTAISYLYNNPVEKQICARAELSRWNFLAYATDNHPFSEKVVESGARWILRKAFQEVRLEHSQDRSLNYAQLERITKRLIPREQAQLTDFIIKTYNFIDYDSLKSHYRSFDDMILAINTNTGSEYDLKEDFTAGSDRIYTKMTKFLLQSKELSSIGDLLRRSEEDRRRLWEPLSIRTGASARQLSKYLHLPCAEQSTDNQSDP